MSAIFYLILGFVSAFVVIGTVSAIRWTKPVGKAQPVHQFELNEREKVIVKSRETWVGHYQRMEAKFHKLRHENNTLRSKLKKAGIIT